MMRYKIVRIEKVIYTGFVNADTIQDAFAEAMKSPDQWNVDDFDELHGQPEFKIVLPRLGE